LSQKRRKDKGEIEGIEGDADDDDAADDDADDDDALGWDLWNLRAELTIGERCESMRSSLVSIGN
jgi:hypothetical protein